MGTGILKFKNIILGKFVLVFKLLFFLFFILRRYTMFIWKFLSAYVSGSNGISSVCSEDVSIKLSVDDSSKDRELSRQTLTFAQLILALLEFKDI